MKHTFTLLWGLIPFLLFAQSWEPIKPGNVYHYQRMQDSLVVSLWVDSSSVVGVDSVRYLNRRITAEGGELGFETRAFLNQPHFLMRQYQMEGDSLFRCLDTTELLLPYTLGIGETHPFSPLRGLDMTLTGKFDSLLFGQIDSVQHFSLSDGQDLWLSKTWGILEFPQLDPDSTGWELIGVEGSLSGGVSMPTFGDFFVWEAGDVLAYSHRITGLSQGYSKRTKLRILETLSQDSLGLRYRAGRIQRISERTGNITETSFIQDTLSFAILDSSTHPVNLHSYELVAHRNEGSLLVDSNYLGFVQVFRHPDGTWTKSLGGYPFTSALYTQKEDTLFSDYGGTYPWGRQVYATGRGMQRYSFGWGLAERGEDSILQAFQTATDTFGVLVEDSILLPIQLSKSTLSLRAYPNPVRDRLVLAWERADFGESIEVQLVDYQGKTLREETVHHSQPSLKIPDLPAGLYVLRIRGREGGILIRKE